MVSWPRGTLVTSLDPADRPALLRLGTQRTYDRNEILLHEGDAGSDVLLLLRGCVRVLSTSASGRTTLLAIRVAGDLLGELSALDGRPRSATVVTAARCTVRTIAHAEFSAHLAAHPAVAQAVQRAVTTKLRQATRFRSDTSGTTVLVRLARVLDRLGTSYGQETAGGVLIDVALTQTELAALVGASEISVHRALGDLRRRGLVQTGYRQLLVCDLDQLRVLQDAS